MSFPINSMVSFHSFLYVYQRVSGWHGGNAPGRARLMPWSVGWGLREREREREWPIFGEGFEKWGDPHEIPMVSICFSSLMTWMGWRKTWNTYVFPKPSEGTKCCIYRFFSTIQDAIGGNFCCFIKVHVHQRNLSIEARTTVLGVHGSTLGAPIATFLKNCLQCGFHPIRGHTRFRPLFWSKNNPKTLGILSPRGG